ncbi:MAG: signal recognition particle-docking protein FtsY [Clostridia bacterium]|nr:signal recognition particle-docking protein FtsY [Clostridia bacterium]
MSFLSRLFEGNKKTKKSFAEKLKYIFTGSDIDEEFYEELEYCLLSSDISSQTCDAILESLREEIKSQKIKKTDDAKDALKGIMISILNRSQPSEVKTPAVIMVVGVNGVGKTTAIGKIANKLTSEGKKVLIAAGDTFRAAASSQLEVWAERAKVKIIKSAEGADPGAVVFDAIASAKAKGCDYLIVDTAGRLHNKANLMEELKKISRIVEREYPEAEYHKALVIDATTGQNALSQVKFFDEAVGITDLIVTKLDGTAKGGFVLSIASDYEVPIRYIGVGEGIDDLLPFSSKDFVDSII